MTAKSQEERLQNETYLASTLILDFLASSSMRNDFLLFISNQLYGILLQQPYQINMMGVNLHKREEKAEVEIGERCPRMAL